MTRTPTLEEVIREAITSRLIDLHVALPGRIELYHPAEQAADVQPLLLRSFPTVDGDEIAERLPIIPKVPIVFPRSSDFFVTFPLKPGDLVTLIFMDRSIDTWTAGPGTEVDPVDTRMHSLSDAVAYPGGYPFPRSLKGAHPTNMVMGQDLGPQIHIKPTGEIHAGSEFATDFVALAQKVLTELNKVATGFNGHIHPGVTTGPGVTGPAGPPPTGTPPTSLSFVAPSATKLKAD